VELVATTPQFLDGIVPLAVVSSLRPVYRVPTGIAELDAGRRRRTGRPSGWSSGRRR